MKTLPAILALSVLAGCVTPTDIETPIAAGFEPPAGTASTVDLAITGTYWMPTTIGISTAQGSVQFPLNASDLQLTVKLRVGTRVAGLDAPASSAMVMVKLVDASNKTVAEAMIMPPEKDATIETTNATMGVMQLVLETHGGSDGEANGDYVAYEISATPRQT